MSILNSNDYKRGYDDGYNAGFNGKEKNYVRAGRSLKFAIHGSPAIDSYRDGYNDGYSKGSYDRMSKNNPQKVYTDTQIRTQTSHLFNK